MVSADSGMTEPRTAKLPEATISEMDGVRYLHLDTPWVQGAMDIRRPRVVVLEYVQRMLAWMLWRPQQAVRQAGPHEKPHPRDPHGDPEEQNALMEELVRVAGIFVRFYTLRRSIWLFNAL